MIVVIAILASVVVINYSGAQRRALNAAVVSEEKKVVKQLELFKTTNNAYPSSIASCPTPATGNLCLVAPSDTEYSYKNISIGTPPQIVVTAGYQQVVMRENAFSLISTAERTSSNEFIQIADLGPVIDRYGLKTYQVSFDVKSANTTNAATAKLYFQNGSTARYGGVSIGVPVTTAYARHTYTFKPVLSNGAVAESWLALYGTYGTGNILTVRNLELSLAP